MEGIFVGVILAAILFSIICFSLSNSYSKKADRAEKLVEDIDKELEKNKDETDQYLKLVLGASELKKYKELLDEGTITQEEFEAKKKQLLGL